MAREMSRSISLWAPRALPTRLNGITGGSRIETASRAMRSRMIHSLPTAGCAPCRASAPVQASIASPVLPSASAASAIANTSGVSGSASRGGRATTWIATRAGTA